MQKKKFKILGFILLIAGMAMSLYWCVGQKTDWDMLRKGNVEALTSSKADNPYYPCVKADGFCFVNGIDKDGVAFIK